MTKQDELIKELDVVWMMGEVHLTKERVANFIISRETKMLDEIEKPLRTGHSDGFKICKALSAIQKYRGDK